MRPALPHQRIPRFTGEGGGDQPVGQERAVLRFDAPEKRFDALERKGDTGFAEMRAKST
jgi:hypothetical protein